MMPNQRMRWSVKLKTSAFFDADLARECARVLKPRGLVYLEVPTEEALRSSFREGHVMQPRDERSADCTDSRLGATLLVMCWSEAAWRAAFEPWFVVDVARSSDEMRVTGTLTAH